MPDDEKLACSSRTPLVFRLTTPSLSFFNFLLISQPVVRVSVCIASLFHYPFSFHDGRTQPTFLIANGMRTALDDCSYSWKQADKRGKTKGTGRKFFFCCRPTCAVDGPPLERLVIVSLMAQDRLSCRTLRLECQFGNFEKSFLSSICREVARCSMMPPRLDSNVGGGKPKKRK